MIHAKSSTPFIKALWLIAGVLIGVLILVILLSDPLLT
jgi:hypothetical protein